MRYHIEFTDKAKEDITFFKKAGKKAVLNKLLTLLDTNFTTTNSEQTINN